MDDNSIANLRKLKIYRFLEAFLGLFSIGFLVILVTLAFVAPAVLSIFLICYSFLMVFKVGMHGIYVIHTYKNLRRWESLDWQTFFQNLTKNKEKALAQIKQLQTRFANNFDWKSTLEKDIVSITNSEKSNTLDFKEVFHIPIFSIYDEPTEVVIRSLKKIHQAGYDLSKILVVISQEARVGKEYVAHTINFLKKESWLNLNILEDLDTDKIYANNASTKKYELSQLKNLEITSDKLNVVVTHHPDGLIGEIKGKASNEDWGGRIGSIFCANFGLDSSKVLVTSLDADSKVGPNFFQMLTYRFCLTKNRLSCGFQPLPVYSNNYLSANAFPRLVAANTTIWYMIQSSLLDELHFFANYSVPLALLEKIDFWNREVIAEDSLLFAKCFIKLKGGFQVVPFYGTFEGDSVIGGDYFETILNQYRQLQRWAWGGIEGFPYKFWNFFLTKEGSEIDLRKRLNLIRLEAINHFFWATSPVVFSVISVLPFLVTDQSFRETPVQYNLWLLSTYFAWISFIFLLISSYITFRFIATKAIKNEPSKWYHWILLGAQWAISPFIFLLWAPPALDVQIRGIFGRYLGYWVTPKK